MRNIQLFVFLSLVSLEALGQTAASAKWSVVDDAVQIRFDDGRTAGISHAIGKIERAKIKMKQIENTCDPGQKMSLCELEMDLASYGTYVRWIQHPDPTKLQQVVEYRFNGENAPKEFFPLKLESGLMFWYATIGNHAFDEFKTPDRLSCDQADWLEFVPVKDNVYDIASWSGEEMFPTTETGVNENQTMSGAFDVKLKRLNANTFEFVGTGPARFQNIPPYASSQIVSLTFPNQGRQCQVTFGIDLQEIAQQLSRPDFKKIDPATERPVKDPQNLNLNAFGGAIRNLFIPGLSIEVQ